MSKRKRRRVKRQAPNLKCDTTPKKEKTWCACQQQVQLPKGGVGHHKGNVGRITFQSGKEPFIPIPTHHPPFSHQGIRDERPSALHASPSGLGSHGKHLQQRVIRKQRRLVLFSTFLTLYGSKSKWATPNSQGTTPGVINLVSTFNPHNPNFQHSKPNFLATSSSSSLPLSFSHPLCLISGFVISNIYY